MCLELICSLVITPSNGLVWQSPAVDRSGEPVLQQMAKAMHDLTGVFATVTRESRDAAEDPFIVSRTVQFVWQARDTFSIDASEYWGGNERIIVNGNSLLEDPCDLAQPIFLRSLKTPIWTSSDRLASRGSMSTAWLYFTAGPDNLKSWVGEKGKVTAVDPPGRWKGVAVETKEFGNMVAYFDEEAETKRVVHIEFDNWPERLRLAEMWPEWVSPPIAGALDVETIHYVELSKSARRKFPTQPPAGMAFIDLREKAPGAP